MNGASSTVVSPFPYFSSAPWVTDATLTDNPFTAVKNPRKAPIGSGICHRYYEEKTINDVYMTDCI